jgi:hypothetical protein
MAPFILFLHPLPYFVVGTLAINILVMDGRTSAAWLWLLAGFYTYILFLGIFVVPRLLHDRRKARGARNA